jgi:predicted RNA-binding Zn ribbon-like protein
LSSERSRMAKSSIATSDTRSYKTLPPKALGGAACLDFINTVAWRGDPERQRERLHSYGELVHWSVGFDLIETPYARRLLAEAAARPRVAERVRRLALRLRDEFADAFDPGRGDAGLAETEGLIHDMRKIGRLVRSRPKGALVWIPLDTPPDLRLPLLPVAISAMALAASDRRRYLRSCADPRCGYVFLDETRNHSRQWCSMEDCGNRAKARAHYARRKVAR